MLRACNILYSTQDEHAFIKLLNECIETKYNSDLGNCNHRPVETLGMKMSGDMADRYSKTSICVFCGEELEPIITYRVKPRLPDAPF